jgi:hypothetical protein
MGDKMYDLHRDNLHSIQNQNEECFMIKIIQVSLLSMALLFSASHAFASEPLPEDDEVGGFTEVGTGNSKVLKAAQFAIFKQSEKTSYNIKLISIVSAKQQLVAGMNYQLILDVSINGETQRIAAVVYSKLDGTYKLISWNLYS